MTPRNDHTSTVKAVLGPTNTGKTHLAIERMVAHPTGMIGLPLRLLAREVYQRVVEKVGPEAVALVTRVIHPELQPGRAGRAGERASWGGWRRRHSAPPPPPPPPLPLASLPPSPQSSLPPPFSRLS